MGCRLFRRVTLALFSIGMSMNFSPQYTIIDDVDSLRDLRTYLATQNIVAIDTEFPRREQICSTADVDADRT